MMPGPLAPSSEVRGSLEAREVQCQGTPVSRIMASGRPRSRLGVRKASAAAVMPQTPSQRTGDSTVEFDYYVGELAKSETCQVGAAAQSLGGRSVMAPLPA